MKNAIVRTAGALAVLFGVATVVSGGRILVGEAARAEAGDVVPFVLWFNTASGLLYVAAGAGLLARQRWGALLSVAIAVAILAAFAALGVHIVLGGAFEPRTVAAMTLRSIVWIAIAAIACRSLGCRGMPRGSTFGTR